MTCRLADDQHAHTTRASVQCLMLLAGRDLEAFTGLNNEIAMLDLERQFAFQDKEELARMNVRVAHLARTWRHDFFNDAQFARPDEMPAVAVRALRSAPLVVLGRPYADDLCGY
jgi:hypothetical protein